jgi:hypothetical protein
MSHNNQSARAVWIFHQVVLSLVLKTVSIMHQVHRAFEAFDDPDQNLTRFVEQRIFPRCDHGRVAHGLTRHSKTVIHLSCRGTESFWILRFLSDQARLSVVGRTTHGLTT